jgi:cytochrome c-type biogenesis protein CcmE
MDDPTDDLPLHVSDDAERARRNPGVDERRPSSWIKIGAVFILLAGGVTLLLVGTDISDVFVYSKLVNEVVSQPGRYAGRELRVEGDLRNGSVRFREDPCEWRFVLEKEGEQMPVRYSRCVVPDTFRDGMGITVTVQGELGQDGTFIASQVIPRCPSKYEMRQRQSQGEEMPHEMPATPPAPDEEG